MTYVIIGIGVLGVLLFGWDKICNWFKAKLPTTATPTVDAVQSEVDELKARFILWLSVRALPGLSAEAIAALDALKAELTKWGTTTTPTQTPPTTPTTPTETK